MADHEADMQELKNRHDAGDKRAVLDALLVCLGSFPNMKPIPDWVRLAFIEAYGKIYAAEVGSWDDVFGRPKGHLDARRRRFRLRYPVWRRARDWLHVRKHKRDSALFEALGREFGIGERQAREMFYEMENAGGRDSNLWTLKPSDLGLTKPVPKTK